MSRLLSQILKPLGYQTPVVQSVVFFWVLRWISCFFEEALLGFKVGHLVLNYREICRSIWQHLEVLVFFGCFSLAPYHQSVGIVVFPFLPFFW